MAESIDIHGLGRRLDAARLALRGTDSISERSVRLISDFADHCESQGMSKGRVTKYIYLLRYGFLTSLG